MTLITKPVRIRGGMQFDIGGIRRSPLFKLNQGIMDAGKLCSILGYRVTDTPMKTKSTKEPVADETASAENTISKEDVEAYANAIWVMEGCPEGRALDHWFLAEAQLRLAQPAQALPAD